MMKMLVGCTHPKHGHIRCIDCDFSKIPNGFACCNKLNNEYQTIRSFIEV